MCVLRGLQAIFRGSIVRFRKSPKMGSGRTLYSSDAGHVPVLCCDCRQDSGETAGREGTIAIKVHGETMPIAVTCHSKRGRAAVSSARSRRPLQSTKHPIVTPACGGKSALHFHRSNSSMYQPSWYSPPLSSCVDATTECHRELRLFLLRHGAAGLLGTRGLCAEGVLSVQQACALVAPGH